MAWFALIVAGLLEVVWAFSMKQSAGFTRLWPTLITLVTMTASRAKMGALVSPRWLSGLATLIAVVIIVVAVIMLWRKDLF